MAVYMIVWTGGRQEERVEGVDIADAFRKAGIVELLRIPEYFSCLDSRGGALPAVNYYREEKEEKENEEKEEKENEWNPFKELAEMTGLESVIEEAKETAAKSLVTHGLSETDAQKYADMAAKAMVSRKEVED